jgi:NitT/TauT family transport system permease protein
MKKSAYLFYSIGIVLILLIWYISAFIVNQELAIPKISSVLRQLVYLLKEKEIYQAFLGSFNRIILGYLTSIVVGIALGVLAINFKFLELIFKPIYLVVKNVPLASILIVLLITVRFAKTPFVLLLIITVPIIYQSTIYGYKSIPNDLKLLNKLDNCSPIQNFFKVTLPLMLPSLLNGLIISIGISVKSEIMAEILSGSTSNIGIGLMLKIAKDNLEIDRLFAITILFILITIIIEFLMAKVNKKVEIVY